MLLALAPAFANPVELDSDAHLRLRGLVAEAPRLTCHTALVAELREHWDHLPAEDRAAATRAIAPFKDDLFAPLAQREGPPPPPATSACWQQGDNVLNGEHFSVQWDSGITEETAERFLESLELGWDKEIEEYGWKEPDGSDRYLILAFVQNQNTGGAYTSVDQCGGHWMPYIVAGKDSWRDGDWGDTMAVHEFNHAIQFAYSYAPEFWWWEATATWMEEYVYPSSDEWASYVWGYSGNPHLALSGSDQGDADVFYHMYGMAIWAFYLDEYQGGMDTVRGTWENAESERGDYNYSAEDMLADLGIEWLPAWQDFSARNTVMDYSHHRVIPEVALADTVSSLPAAGESKKATRPEGYGHNFVKFEKGFGEGDLIVEFSGDDDVPWSVQLVESGKKAVLRSSDAIFEEGWGTVSLTDVGAEDVYLVVSPLDPDDKGHSYSWSAEIGEIAEAAGEEELAACGCASGGGTAFPASLALLALAGLRRVSASRR